ncbi:MAG: type II secretion system protein GspG [Candidatus Binatia bacterium]
MRNQRSAEWGFLSLLGSFLLLASQGSCLREERKTATMEPVATEKPDPLEAKRKRLVEVMRELFALKESGRAATGWRQKQADLDKEAGQILNELSGADSPPQDHETILTEVVQKYAPELYEKLRKRRIAPKRRSCQRFINNLTQGVKNYEFDQNEYPPSGNASLYRALNSQGPRVIAYFILRPKDLTSDGLISDPWGNPLVYRRNFPGPGPEAKNRSSFDIYSFGPDGKDDKGSWDDVNNWD